MNRLAGKKKWIVLVCFIIFISWYMYNSLYIVFYYNNKIDVDGIKLLQTEEEVNQNKIIANMVKSYNPRKGYESSNLEIYFGDYGVFNGKLCTIKTSDPKYSIIGIKVGDAGKDAANKLKKSGFKKRMKVFIKDA